MPFRIARSFAQILVSLALAIPLGTGLVWVRSGLARAGDATLDCVGHLISQHLCFLWSGLIRRISNRLNLNKEFLCTFDSLDDVSGFLEAALRS